MSRSPTFRPDVAASVWTCASSTVAAALGMAGLVLTGCVGDRTSDGDPAVVGDGAGVPIVSVTVPPERLTPFCQAMIDLSERLETDPPDDTAALIIETYEGVGGDVPAEDRGRVRRRPGRSPTWVGGHGAVRLCVGRDRDHAPNAHDRGDEWRADHSRG